MNKLCCIKSNWLINSWSLELLTANVQLDGIALAVAFTIAAHAGVDASSSPARILQHQTLIGHDDALGGIILQYRALQRNEARVKRDVPQFIGLNSIWR